MKYAKRNLTWLAAIVLLSAVNLGKVSESIAAPLPVGSSALARSTGSGTFAQAFELIQEGKSINNAVNMMQAVKALSGERGETTTDMFGFDDSAMREAEEMAKIASRKQTEMSQDVSAVTGASKRPEVAKKYGVAEQTVLNVANTYNNTYPKRKVNISTIENLIIKSLED